jgi:CheY-like chemotaxis protein
MPKTLLLADDSVVIQKLVGLSFANEDVEVLTVDNGDEAITLANEARPDMVLADVVMPGKSGYEVCDSIKQNPALANTPVLLLTGTFEAFDEERAQQVGADGHITKPFEAQALVDEVNQLLSRSRDSDAAAPVAAASDFFDDNFGDIADLSPVMEPLTTAEGMKSESEDFAFGAGAGEPLAVETAHGTLMSNPANESLDRLLEGAGGDRTIAMMPEVPAPVASGPDSISDPLMSTPPPPPLTQAPRPAAEEPPASSSAMSSDPLVMGVAPAVTPDPAAPVTPSVPNPGETVLADDNFGFGGAEPSSPTPAEPLPTMDRAAGFADTRPDSSSPPAIDAAPVDAGESLDLDDLSFGDQSTTPPVTMSSPADETVLAGDLFSHPSTPMEPAFMAPPPIEQPIEQPVAAAPIAPEALTPPDLATTSPRDDAALETNFESPAMPASNGLDLNFPEADISAPNIPDSIVLENADAYDVSTSDLRIDPMNPAVGVSGIGSDPSLPEATPAMIDELEETPGALPVLGSKLPGEEPLDTAPSEFEPFDAQPPYAEPSAAEPMFEAEPWAPMVDLEPSIETLETLDPIPTLENLGGGLPDLSPMMRDRIHDTLEKVAWEAFSDLSESIVKQVLEHVEQVAWEVIPQMAETLIQEEIRRMKDETE